MTWEQLISHPSVERVGRSWAEGRWKKRRFVIRQGNLGDRPLVILELILCREGELDPTVAWRRGGHVVGALAIAKGSWVLRHAVLADGLEQAGLDAYWDALGEEAERTLPRRTTISAAPVFLHFAV
jgi:hypothetical protein